jgi:hypothetical protein
MRHTEESYRREWATLTGKSEREIYVPRALREEETCPELSAPSAGTSSTPSST